MSSRVALITGSSKGIGLSLTKFLLEEKFHVYGYSRTNKLKNPNFCFHKTDLSDLNTLKNIIFPNLDSSEEIFLINNAGEIGDIKKYGNKDLESIVNEININLSAPTIICNKFIKKYGGLKSKLTIINISSGAALRPIKSWGTYCQSKAGIDMLTKIINEENEKIKAYSIYPGVVNTEMQEKIRNTSVENFPLKDKFVDYYEKNQLTNPETVASKIYYIMSNLSEFSTNLISLRDF